MVLSRSGDAAAEHRDPEAAMLPRVDSHEHPSALIHPRERSLVSNCIFVFKNLSQVSISPRLEQDNPFPV